VSSTNSRLWGIVNIFIQTHSRLQIVRLAPTFHKILAAVGVEAMSIKSFNSNVYSYLVSAIIAIGILTGSPLTAQTLAGYTFCLDPGHGPGNTNTGPTGLHEHVINLRAARALSDLLYSVQADTVILTRDETTTTNPTLTQREQIANSNNVDWFHSVHHNATGWPENPSIRYTLVLYSENSDHTPLNPGSENMAPLISQRVFEALRTSEYRVFGDYSFYGTPNYLGVLNDLTMPSELSEATFHDHPGEEAKLYNPDFTRLEGRGIFYGMLDYFTGIHYTDGVISGIITDSDTNLPLDSVRVTLAPGDSIHFTDNHHSGFFAFRHLPPGQYTVSIEKSGYMSLTDSVQVHAGLYDFADFSTGSTARPTVISATPEDSTTGQGIWDDLTLTFSRPMNRQSVSSALYLYNSTDSLTWLSTWSDGDRRLEINPLGALLPVTWYQLEIDTTALDQFGHHLVGSAGATYFALNFRTHSTDSLMIPIAIYPNEQERQVMPAQTVAVHFSHPLAAGVDYTNKLIILSDNFRRIYGRVDTDTTNGLADGLTLIPDVLFEPGRSYTATLLNSIADTAGLTLEDHFSWTFWVSGRHYEVSVLDSGSTPDNWDVDYLDNATAWAESVTRPAIHDSTAYRLAISRLTGSTASEAGLRWAGAPLDLEPGQSLGFYACGAPVFIYAADGSHLNAWPASRGWHFYSFTAQNSATVSGIGFQLPENVEQADAYLDQIILVTDITEIRPDKALTARNFRLTAYPNPFNSTTIIPLPLQERTTKLTLYNLLGEQIIQMQIPAGQPTLKLDFNRVAPTAPSGVYLLKVSNSSRGYTTKLLYLK